MEILAKIFILAFLAQNILSQTDQAQLSMPRITSILEKDQKVNVLKVPLDDPAVIETGEATRVILLCEAAYPIEWDLRGVFLPVIVHSFYVKRNNTANEFLLRIILDLKDNSSLGSGISLQVSCKSTRNFMLKRTLYIFTKGNSTNTLLQTDSNTVFDVPIIPCPTIDPTQDVKLYMKSEKGVEKLVNETIATYNPTVGFITEEEMFVGVYVCRQNDSSVTINALSSDNENTTSSDVLSFRKSMKEAVSVVCYGPPEPRAISNFSEEISIDFKFLANFLILQISLEEPLTSVGEVKGSVKCLTNVIDDNYTVEREYYIEFVNPPELYFDKDKHEIICRSAFYPVLLEIVNCRNNIECWFVAEHCEKNLARCGGGNRKTIVLKGEMTYNENGSVNESRVVLKYNEIFNAGIARCTVSDISEQLNFFISLEGNPHTNWKDASEEEVIRIYKENSSVNYENTTTRYVCEALEFAFADGLLFQLEFRNGSQVYLNEKEETDLYAMSEHPAVPQKVPYRFVTVLDLDVPVDAAWLHCVAFLWNSIKPIIVSELLESKRASPPTFSEKSGDDKGRLNEIIYKGQKDFMLTCSTTGNPQPKYLWYVNGSDVLKRFPLLIVGLDPDTGSFLKFPAVDSNAMKMYLGLHYECVAMNAGGKVVKRFLVRSHTPDAPISGTQGHPSSYHLFITIILHSLHFLICTIFGSIQYIY